mmetsp:Transcript_1846/g.4263  ORF Transcript_1846/g.4263 Transcript_1846/m.4263 type:complete len:231 (-) Transcript_1846:316-1008(-)
MPGLVFLSQRHHVALVQNNVSAERAPARRAGKLPPDPLAILHVLLAPEQEREQQHLAAGGVVACRVVLVEELSAEEIAERAAVEDVGRKARRSDVDHMAQVSTRASGQLQSRARRPQRLLFNLQLQRGGPSRGEIVHVQVHPRRGGGRGRATGSCTTHPHIIVGLAIKKDFAVVLRAGFVVAVQHGAVTVQLGDLLTGYAGAAAAAGNVRGHHHLTQPQLHQAPDPLRQL